MNKEYNDYVRKNDENCQVRFSMSLKELFEIPENELTLQQRDFIKYYNKFLPVIDSDCVMNNVCKYIESIDFHIKQKVKSNKSFDYRILLGENFNVNNALLVKIDVLMRETFKRWDETNKEIKNSVKVKNKASTDKDGKKISFDKDLAIGNLKRDLENICSNEEQLANHVIYWFYEVKPSASKTVMWTLIGRQIYLNMKKKTKSYYFPVKNPNGTLEFLYDKYSIERIIVNQEEESIGLDDFVKQDYESEQ